MSKPNYRPDIDGLRAVAVLSVILFHINAAWLPSGYLGVDVFFVISGYLITSIISREMAEQRFSFVEFYKRRAKRILPVFLFVLGVTSAAAWYLFMPDDFYAFLRSARSAMLFGSNFHFGKAGGYFDTASAEKPLLHIWSLSLEEQYYFVFPVILLLLYRFAGRRLVPAAVALLIAASLLCGLIPTTDYDSYFLPHVRAFELLIGSLFAFFPTQSAGWQGFLRRFGSPFSLLMLAVVVGCMFVPKDWLPFAGYIERLLACTASALLIASGSLNTAAGARLLALKPMVAVGLISYSLYLWHWVVLALLRYAYMRYELPAAAVAGAVAAMFALSLLSYFLVENPVRRIKNFSHRRFGIAMLCYALLAGGTAGAVRLYKNQMQAEAQAGGGTLPWDGTAAGELTWDNNICFARWDIPCTKGALDTPPSVLMVGDSHAAQYNRFIDKVGKHEGWSGDVIASGACAYLYQNNNLSDHYPAAAAPTCLGFRKHIDGIINRYDTVIIAQAWGQAIEQRDYLPELERTIQYLLKQNKQVYLFQDQPYATLPPNRLYHFAQRGIPALAKQSRLGGENSGNQTVKALAAKYPQVKWLDLTGYIPEDFTHNGKPMYQDATHINPYGAEQIAERFIADGKRLKAAQPTP